MLWTRFAEVLLGAVLSTCASVLASQVPFTSVDDATLSWSSRPWNERASGDTSGNLVFQSLASLLQMMPNSKYPIGHSIARATIPQGTLLHHGRHVGGCPSMDWIAFDPEHAMLFAFGMNGTLQTYITTRDLQLVYFDGSSGNARGGTVDTQDILFWGEPGKREKHELDRLVDGCTWAKQYGMDGILRMEFDFEIMYCDFSQGLELVSTMSSINPWADDDPSGLPSQGPTLPGGHCTPGATFHGLTKESLDAENLQISSQTLGIPPFSYPKGWKGILPSVDVQAFFAGTWHNRFPGETRVRVDPSSLISLFDPALTSLAEARRSMTRDQYRPANISKADMARWRADIADVMARDLTVKSAIDWQSLARVIQERFGDRERGLARVRKQLIVSLIPYMPRANIGKPEWFAAIARNCAVRFTDHLPRTGFTKQEHLLYHAVEEVLHEICRVYTEAWVDAFDAEKPAALVQELLAKWRDEFDLLMEWLDWPVWIKCDPACGVEESCWVPQGQPWTPDGDHEPRCIRMDFEGFVPPTGLE
ncbi:uncharacterized protein C8Q71DRAFT_855099 [Rhodofomes roseus]|uniref:Uncharacterized protein n=1 Tax=Rhodofomes roseus TaxID=34475 RepID=A0ABQ8KN25_9APHY|nr:uncharacterized protein C8Q71DRAFT_855099 [Rhodofomes roseus]KAH9839790.1 hypothetical protein C8Q71DRAFT_855099 [Rhodofomes roseus]